MFSSDNFTMSSDPDCLTWRWELHNDFVYSGPFDQLRFVGRRFRLGGFVRRKQIEERRGYLRREFEEMWARR